MLTIQSKEKEIRDEDGKNRKGEFIIVNGIEDRDSYYSKSYDLSSAHIYNKEIIDILINHSFKDVGQSLTYFEYGEERDWWENWVSITVYCHKLGSYKIPMIKLNMEFQEWEHWNKPWSVARVAEEFEREVLKLNDNKLKYWQDDPDSIVNGFGIEYYPDNINSSIKMHIESILSLLETVVDASNKNLIHSLNTNAVIAYFKFPNEIKTACEQYLVYFAQFIADMGIFVDTELKYELNQTLFKITPKDKNESLEKIREALDIYLNAPSQESFQIQIASQLDIAAKQWEANVYHLKSQLTLANSMIQLKDATIESLQLSNYQYKQTLELQKPKNETEEVVKGMVTIKKYDGKWFEINLPEIFRRLKRTFTK